MTYQITLTGHGAASDDVIEVFENTVRALRAVNAEGIKDVKSGISADAYLSGSAGGTGIDGDNFTKNANDVQDLDEEEVLDDDTEEEADPGEAPDDSETEAGVESDDRT
jgi:hypothetical protein